ncbi:MAG: mannosyltransferase [Bacteroidales bacterium 45-6]|nr:MAG: mannosyltransferase [Bacteroidales bacterium 45-6]
MKIGFDGKRAVQNNTGLGNYSRYLVEILSAYFPENHYVLFAPKRCENPRLEKLKCAPNVSFLYPKTYFWKQFSSLWRLFGIKADLKREKPNVYHGLSNELPLGIARAGIKSVVTIHDLIFLRYPDYYKPIDRLIYRFKFRYACRKADKVIAVSECSKRDIVSFFRIPEEKIEVVYQGCHPCFREEVAAEKRMEVSRKYSLPKQYLLYVGTVESRKNLLLVVKALKLLSPEISLVAVGKKTPYQDLVEKYASEHGVANRLQIFNGIPFADLPAFYAQAKAFVYPSFFEGFGIPLVEALSQGIPAIAATGSCLEEAGGPDSIYVDPLDEVALAEKIEKIWHDPEFASSMAKAGKSYVERFSDEEIARQLMAVYSSLL